MHPYRDKATRNDPSWIKKYASLKSDDAERERRAASKKDAEAALRNYGGDAIITDKAAYAKKGG